MHFSSRRKRQPSNNFSLNSGNLLRVFKIRKLFGSKLLSERLKFSFGNASQTLVVKVLQKICFFGTVDNSCFRWKCYAGRPYKQFWGTHWKLFRWKTPETFRFIKKFLVQVLKARVEGSFEGTIPARSAQNQWKRIFSVFSEKLLPLKMFSRTLMRATLTKVKKVLFQKTENHWCIRKCIGLLFLSMPGKMFWTAPAKRKISRLNYYYWCLH